MTTVFFCKKIEQSSERNTLRDKWLTKMWLLTERTIRLEIILSSKLHSSIYMPSVLDAHPDTSLFDLHTSHKTKVTSHGGPFVMKMISRLVSAYHTSSRTSGSDLTRESASQCALAFSWQDTILSEDAVWGGDWGKATHTRWYAWCTYTTTPYTPTGIHLYTHLCFSLRQ